MVNRMKEIRELKGMTQEDLANKSGISRQTISAIENQKYENIKIKTLFAIADALDSTFTDIFSRQTNRQNMRGA